MTQINDLPPELIQKILAEVGPMDLIKMPKVWVKALDGMSQMECLTWNAH